MRFAIKNKSFNEYFCGYDWQMFGENEYETCEWEPLSSWSVVFYSSPESANADVERIIGYFEYDADEIIIEKLQ